MQDFLADQTTQKVIDELLRQINDSLKEERVAVDIYRRRANYARRGYPEVAERYDHILDEEEQHIKELEKMAEKLRRKRPK
jgi:rubrerythrin